MLSNVSGEVVALKRPDPLCTALDPPSIGGATPSSAGAAATLDLSIGEQGTMRLMLLTGVSPAALAEDGAVILDVATGAPLGSRFRDEELLRLNILKG